MIEAAAGLLIGGMAALRFGSYQPKIAAENGTPLLLILGIMALGLMRREAKLCEAVREVLLMLGLCAIVVAIGNAFGVALRGGLHVALIATLFIRASRTFTQEDAGADYGV